MKNLDLLKAFMLGIAIAAAMVFLWKTSETASAQVEQGSSRYRLHSGEFNYPTAPGQPPGRGQGTFKLDTQTGQAWILDAKNNRWVAVNG
jgi:hypothetical protein